MSLKNDILSQIKTRLETLESIHINFPALTPIYLNPFREIGEDADLPAMKIALLKGTSEYFDSKITYKNTDTLIIVYQQSGDVLTDLNNELYEIQEKITDFIINDSNNSGLDDSLYNFIEHLEFKSWNLDFQAANYGHGIIVMEFEISYFSTHELVYPDLETVEVDLKHKETTEDTNSYSIDSITLPTS